MPEIKDCVIIADQLFDGITDEALIGRAVVVENGFISEITRSDTRFSNKLPVVHVAIAAPGFIDLQINGAKDALFNDNPSQETLALMAAGAREGGTAYLLPTFITAPSRAYKTALAAINLAIMEQLPGIIGVHLEGPFLNQSRKGIHRLNAIRKIDDTDLEFLSVKAPYTRLITLAPEEMPVGAIAQLVRAGVTVFAGHSAATSEQIQSAVTEGLRGVTHLFNAMSQMTGREPGVVGATLTSKNLFASIIADGFHVHSDNIALAASIVSADRLFVVTDAMQTLAGKLTSFDLYGSKIQLTEGQLTDQSGRLAGAHLAMDQALQNLMEMTDLSLADGLRMTSTTPATAIGRLGELGLITVGGRASLTLLDDDLACQGVVVDGTYFPGEPRRKDDHARQNWLNPQNEPGFILQKDQ